MTRKNPTKRVVKEDFKVTATNVEKHYRFTERRLKVAYDINIDIHHRKKANSTNTIILKFD